MAQAVSVTQLSAHEVRVGDPHGVVAERLRESHLLDDDGKGLAAEDADVEFIGQTGHASRRYPMSQNIHS